MSLPGVIINYAWRQVLKALESERSLPIERKIRIWSLTALRATIESILTMLDHKLLACILPGRDSSTHNPCVAVTEYP